MDAERFDTWAKTLATRTSRRAALRGLAGGAIAAFGLRRLEVAAQPAQVIICHWDATQGVYEQLSVSVNGLEGHGRHSRDILTPEFTSTTTCGDCNTACLDGQACIAGTCVSSCVPDCTGKTCGDNGCGGSCGSCPEGTTCLDDVCDCEPQPVACGPNDCGPLVDNCDAIVGECTGGCTCVESYQACTPGVTRCCSGSCTTWGDCETSTGAPPPGGYCC
jgi:hypothetical protein